MNVERRGVGEVVAGLVGVGVLAAVGSCVLKEVGDLDDRAGRLNSGSEASEAVAEENPPGGVPTVPGSEPDHTTPPVSEAVCVYVAEYDLDYRQRAFADALARNSDEKQGALADCEGGVGASVGNPTTLGGRLTPEQEGFVLETNWDLGVESPTGRYVIFFSTSSQP